MKTSAEDIESQTRAELMRPLDPAHPPLLRFRLMLHSRNRFTLLLVIHHLVADAWSLRLLLDELLVSYAAAREGRAPRLAALPFQFGDFARWQKELTSRDRLAEDLAYWSGHLKDLPEQQLALDRPRPPKPRFRGAELSLCLDDRDATSINTLARRAGATPFMVLSGALRVCLLRTMGQGRVVLGTMLSGRDHPDLEQLIGFFARTVVLYAEVMPEYSFATVLKNERRVFLEAWSHRLPPFEWIVNELVLKRSLSMNPLFQIMFVMQPMWVSTNVFGSLKVRAMPVPSNTVEFDIVLRAYETAGGLEFCLSYDSEIFHRETIERLILTYRRVLSIVARNEEMLIGAIPLPSAAERRSLMEGFNERFDGGSR